MSTRDGTRGGTGNAAPDFTRGSAQGAGGVHIVGRACRLPGAADCDAFWRVLAEGRTTVSRIGDDRWPTQRYLSRRAGEIGKSLTFAAGVLDDIWGFDPAAFGISPREAQQMDPQQRLLLEVVAEALEDAGVPPSRLAGRNVGVFVGISSPDSSTRRAADVGTTDPYLMTGSTLSLAANRLSYVFDWSGPSLAIDTACSSGLVALAQAVEALRAGRIETAVVGAVNVLLSPFPFIGFSAARMLSPEGLCRPFDAGGQGYVRAEGAVAFLLTRAGSDIAPVARRYAEILAVGVNSDGRTSGVSLPSAHAQAALLADVYGKAGIAPESLAFVEAHGTGTRVGDPAEAEAIGIVLGRARTIPLPIGSVKGNIGHLEPAAGLAGVLKALLAFEHGVLPASLHFETPNPAIPFADLNIAVARAPIPLGDGSAAVRAGVSAFGFGGTNAHVVLEAARCDHGAERSQPTSSKIVALRASEARASSGPLMLSAHSEAGLVALAAAWRELLVSGEDSRARLDGLAAAIQDQRDVQSERLAVVAETTAEAADVLAGVATRTADRRLVRGRAVARNAPVAFVYAGNGSQWAGMGRAAYAANAVFRARFDALARAYRDIGGIDLAEVLGAPDLAERLTAASVAQPLLFAVQAAMTDALADAGLTPDVVVGHSVGEVAAAYAAGCLDAAQALAVIAARSASQEAARGLGGMIAVAVAADELPALIAQSGVVGLELAAINAPHGVTLSGPHPDVVRFAAFAAGCGVTHKVLDLDYPFHSSLLAETRGPLVDALADLRPTAGHTRFVSTVFANVVPGEILDAEYWWRNVRAPVRFSAGIAAAADAGARVFVEIGPRPVLSGYVKSALEDIDGACAVVASLTREDVADVDPVRLTLARALVHGARADRARMCGAADREVRLPATPWQRQRFEVSPSIEASTAVLPDGLAHRLLGWPERAGQTEWFMHLDADTWPAFADHAVGGSAIMPGAGLCEMALAAARAGLGEDRAEVYDLDILAPLALPADHMREVRTRYVAETQGIEIASRRRLTDEDWQVHARARATLVAKEMACPTRLEVARLAFARDVADGFYPAARALGLDYGPAFRRLEGVAHDADGIVVAIAPGAGAMPDDALIDPVALDVAFHGLLADCLMPAGGASGGDTRAFLPVRFGRVVLDQPGKPVRFARIDGLTRGARQIVCGMGLFDADGTRVAMLEGVRFQEAELVGRPRLDDMAVTLTVERLAQPVDVALSAGTGPLLAMDSVPADAAMHEGRLLVEALAQRVAVDAVRGLADADGVFGSGDGHGAGDRLAPWAHSALDGLARALGQAGLAARAAVGWRLTAVADALPDRDALVGTVLADHPTWWPDCALIVRAGELWSEDLTRQQPPAFTPSMWAAYREASPRFCSRADGIMRTLDGVTAARWDGDPARISVAMVGEDRGGLLGRLASRASRDGAIALTAIAEAACERMRAALPEASPVAVIDLTGFAAEGMSPEVGGPFDVVVCAALADDEGTRDLVRRLLPNVRCGGVLLGCLATESVTGALLAVGQGAMPGRSGAVVMTDGASLQRVLAEAGLDDVVVAEDAACGAVFAEARFARVPATSGGARGGAVVVMDDGDGAEGDTELSTALIVALAGEGRRVRRVALAAMTDVSSACDAADGAPSRTDLVWMLRARAWTDGRGVGQALADTLAAFARLIGQLDGTSCRLWLVLPGGVRGSVGRGASDVLAAGLWAAARTAANEHGNLDIRRIDVADGVRPAEAARGLARLLASPPTDTEVIVAADGIDAVRAQALPPVVVDDIGDAATGVRLERTRQASGARVVWSRVARRAPDAGEIEVAVAATGLNFRDAMWSLGLLPEEALEDGFAGPTLGLECAGRVARVGANVTGFAVGQAVLAFAPHAFSSHVTVGADAVIAVPDGLTPEAAATLPVAFLTAYYALHELARLEPGETVLIHGGAGGVGLAALQVAQWRGARVIATAGTPEKRALLAALGADHVLDSRSVSFAGEVREITRGVGVDVVLNSLAGAAMEKSLALVKPFGRFLELGKRDFYGHTHIALRPFRRNVSYFGIDADQLLAHKPALTRRLIAEVMALVADGTFAPLPYRAFAGGAAADAFRLIQQSGHIGKIVVTPPRLDQVAACATCSFWRASGEGAYVIVGGTGGFGLATARWLAQRGARTIVLVSRSGKVMAGGEPTFAALTATGADIRFARADVADDLQMAALLERIRAEMPIRGIVHAAMVLDDQMLCDVTATRAADVIRPKVDGARVLDRLTRGDTLDVFVLYGSVTALIGNPGQAAYVAANAALGAIAETRRAAGLPALAVGWGGITDVGVLARDAEAGRAIARRTGGAAFSSDVALDALGALLARGRVAPAVVTVAPMAWDMLAEQLPVAGQPLFAALAGARGRRVRRDTGQSVVADEIRGLDADEARAAIASHLVVDVARILRMPASGIATDRPLSDFGMDSLMALELRLAVQKQLGVALPLAAMAGSLTLGEMAARIQTLVAAGVGGDGAPEVAGVADLAVQHLGGGGTQLDGARLAPLLDRIDRSDRRRGAAT